MIPAEDRPSKTQRKKAMHALQTLGEQLVDLNRDQLAKIPLPDDLREAIAEAQRITAHEGRRRQMQFIGRLMREIDPEPIRGRLAALQGVSREETMIHHTAERWRDRLLEDDAEVRKFAERYPAHSPDPLAIAAREARKERLAGTDPRHYRELYRAIRAIVEQDIRGSSAAAAPGGAPAKTREEPDDS